ncbi:GDSL esterase/lipase LTL1, partial [Zea mays]
MQASAASPSSLLHACFRSSFVLLILAANASRSRCAFLVCVSVCGALYVQLCVTVTTITCPFLSYRTAQLHPIYINFQGIHN